MTPDIRPVVFRNVRLPLREVRSDARWDVATQGSEIAWVEPAAGSNAGRPERDHALEIDGNGRFLIPGLSDGHVHFRSRDDATNESLARLYLANGVTSVFCMGGSGAVLSLRERVRTGIVAGPEIYSTSPIQNDPDLTPERARRRVRRYRGRGFDGIKVYNRLQRDTFGAICEEASRTGFPVVGHIVRSVGALDTIDSYQSAVVHAECFVYTYFAFGNREPNDDEDAKLQVDRLPALAERAAQRGLKLVTTLQAFRGIVGQFDDVTDWLRRPEFSYLPAPIAARWRPAVNKYAHEPFVSRRLHANFRFQHQLVRAFHAAGVTVIGGTDALVTGAVPGFSMVEEVANLVAAGLSNRDALVASTETSARLFGDIRLGRLESGGWADLLLVAGDPLQDVANLRSIDGVMARGRWFDRRALDRLLAEEKQARLAA